MVSTYQPIPADVAWGEFKSAGESLQVFKLPPEDAGYVLRIESLDDPTQSPFVDYDDKGNEKPRAIQTKVKFTIVDYPNDDPANSMIGQSFTQFFRISMHTKARFFAMAKAAFGGAVDPQWKPRKGDLEGRLISAVIKHKEPNDKGQVYPKIGDMMAYRGKKTYDDVVAVGSAALDEPVDGVPF